MNGGGGGETFGDHQRPAINLTDQMEVPGLDGASKELFRSILGDELEPVQLSVDVADGDDLRPLKGAGAMRADCLAAQVGVISGLRGSAEDPFSLVVTASAWRRASSVSRSRRWRSIFCR